MFQNEFCKPQGIFLTQNGVICPRHPRFHYFFTPSNSFRLGHWPSAGMRLPQSDVELPSFGLVIKVIIVHFKKRTPALTLEKNRVALVHTDAFLSFSMLLSKFKRLYPHAMISAMR